MAMSRVALQTLLAAALLTVSSQHVFASQASVPQPPEALDRPNIILVLADDLGFTDLGSYGSEIKTPTLDTLAQEGVRFTTYHTAANCAPARAMLLTAVW